MLHRRSYCYDMRAQNGTKAYFVLVLIDIERISLPL